MIKEIWKDIKDFEGLYQISNLGRIKSLGNKTHNKWVNCFQAKGFIFKEAS